MAKYVLGASANELDFALIGITCPENQYTMVGLLDNALQINLRLDNYIPFALKDSRMFKFSLYSYFDEALGLDFSVIPNASNLEEPHVNSGQKDLFEQVQVDESVRLIKELPKTDYFLILKGDDLHNYQFKIISKLKTIDAIVQVLAIETSELPSKRNLIF